MEQRQFGVHRSFPFLPPQGSFVCALGKILSDNNQTVAHRITAGILLRDALAADLKVSLLLWFSLRQGWLVVDAPTRDAIKGQVLGLLGDKRIRIRNAIALVRKKHVQPYRLRYFLRLLQQSSPFLNPKT